MFRELLQGAWGCWSPAAIGLGRRGFLLVLLLAAGQAAVLPEAFAQTTPDPSSWARQFNYWGFETLPANPPFATATQQTIKAERTDGVSAQWINYVLYACSWTTVTPASTTTTLNAVPTGCRIIRNRVGGSGVSRNVNFTPTAAEITNRGVVLVWSTVQGGQGSNPNIRHEYAEWVPLATPVTLALAPASITENGGLSTVTVAALGTTSSTAVTVTVTPVAGAYTVTSGATIVIAAGSTTNATDSVTIRAVDNATDEPDRMVAVTGRVSGGYRVNTAAELTLTDDDAAPGVTLALAPGAIAENGGTTTVTAALTHPSSAATTVTLAAAAGAYTVGADTTIVIAAGDTANAADTVVLTGEDNATDAPDRTVTVSAEAANAQGIGAVTGAELTLTDDDAAPGATLTLTPAAIAESGGVATVTAVLTHPSSLISEVTVTPAAGFYTVGADAMIEIAAGATANAADTVTVAAVDDAADTADRTVTVTGTLANRQGAGAVTGAELTLTDDDTRGVTLSGATLTVQENETETYTVVLDTQPVGGAVTVTATSADTAVATVASPALVFTAGNWATAQAVTVAGADDQVVTNDRTVQVTHAVDGADYTGETVGAVDVTVTDDELAGLRVSPTRLTVREQGAAAAYTVRLNIAPAAGQTVTVTVAGMPAGKLEADTDPDTTGAQDTLTFTDATWETPQRVEVRGLDDADGVDVTGTVTHSVAGLLTGLAPAYRPSVQVTVEDNDTAGVTLSAETLALTEDHMTEGSLTYTVVLEAAPTAGVTVTLTARPAGAVTVAPGALTFDATTWDTAQTVTASAATDADAADAAVTVTHGLTGAAEYAALEAVAVAVTVADDEEPAVWVDGMSATRAVTVAEGGAATYPVTLGSAPTAPVVVRIGSDNPEVYARPGVLRFDASTWDTAQMVTVRADPDADARADAATLRHTAAGGDYTGTTAAVTVTVTDDDAAVEISRQAVSMLEGETNTYTVTLEAEPAGTVTVGVASGAVAQATVAPAALVFNPATWATAQTVTVTGAGAGSATLSHTVAGYGAVTTATNVAVTVVPTTERLVVDPRFMEVLEGTHVTYTIRLATQPAAGVTWEVRQQPSVSVGAGANCNNMDRPNGVYRTFDENNWATPQVFGIANPNRTNNCGAGHRKQIPHRIRPPGGSTIGDTFAPIVLRKLLNTVPILSAVANQTGRMGQEMNVRLGAGVEQVRAGPHGPGGINRALHNAAGIQTGSSTQTYVNGPLTYTLTGPETDYPANPATTLTLPAGLRFDAAARSLRGRPTQALPATTYRLRVADAQGDTNELEGSAAVRLFTLTVEAAPLPGFARQEPPVRHPLGRPVTPPQVLPRPDVAAGTTPVLTFVVAPRLPEGLTYVPPPRSAAGTYADGGRIVGTPTRATSSREYTLTVVDGDGSVAETTFALATGTAAPAPPPDPGPDPALEDRQPTFGAVTVPAQVYRQGEAIAPLGLPAATDGDGALGYTLTPALPAGLTYTAPADATSGGTLAGVPAAAQAATTYTLTATDADGDAATLTFTLAVEAAGPIRVQEGTRTYQRYGRQVTVTQAPGTPAGVEVTLPPTLAQAVTITVRLAGAEVPLVRGRYGFGPAGAEVAVDITVTPVPADGLGVCLPVPAAVRTAAAGRTVELLHYDGRQWGPVAGSRDDVAAGQVCAPGVTTFSPFAVGYTNDVPRFGEAVPPQTYLVNEAIAPLELPAATGGDGVVRYTLTPLAALPAGLRYTPPADPGATGGVIAGTPVEGRAATTYTLTATDTDGDADTVTFTIEVVRIPVQVTIGDALAVEGATVEFPVTLSRAVSRPLTLRWTAGRPGSATPGADYPAEAAGRLVLAAGTTAGTLRVPTVDDRRVEPTETFTVTATLPADPLFESAEATATGRIEDDDTEQARKRSLGMVLAGVGRTLATDAVDVIGDRFVRSPGTPQATVGGQALNLHRAPQTGRWRQAAGVTYGVARALGVEVGSPLEGGDGPFGQVRGAAWHTLTRHLRDPHAAAPLSAWDTPSAFPAPAGTDPGGPPPTGWGSLGRAGAVDSIPLPPGRGAGATPFGRGAFPGLAGYGTGLGQGGFDRAHAATPQALKVGAFRAPVQFRRVSGAEVLSQSEFELPLRQPAPATDAPTPVGVTEADPAAPVPPVEPAPQAAAAAWTLWGRGTGSGFDGKPKDDFSMDGNVFTGYLGLDYRLQPNVLLGLAVAHSQGDVDYETRDVTKGDVDLTLTSVLPYAHWSPRPGLGVWGLFGAGWGDLQLRDEAGKVKTDLEMLMAAVGARQEVLTWRRIDVALKADAFLTELEAGADDRLPKTAGDAQRLRLMVEGRTAWALSEDAHLTPVFEVGGRWDGGKAETGVGAELGGGFAYAHTKLGLGIEARGRYLLAHQKAAFDEWGASLTLKLDPGEAKRGLWLALAPVWGAEASQVEQMWGSAEVLQAGAESDTKPGLSPAQVEFDVGYGLVTHEGAGLLTTYGGVSMAGPQSHGYRLGGRIELGEWIDLSVEGERTTQGSGAAHQVALYGHLGW